MNHCETPKLNCAEVHDHVSFLSGKWELKIISLMTNNLQIKTEILNSHLGRRPIKFYGTVQT